MTGPTDPGGRTAAAEQALHESEQRLRESEARYRGIVEGAEDFAIVSFDEHGLITSWNVGAERLLGFSEAEAIGQPGDIFFTPEDRAHHQPDHEMNRAATEGRAVDERWHLRKDGSRFWGSGLMMAVENDGYLKIFRDRTAEHGAEAALRESEGRYRTLFEKIEAGFCTIEILFDDQGVPFDYRYLEANPAFERQAGFGSPVGRTVREIVPDHEQFWYDFYAGIVRTGEPGRTEYGSAALGRWWAVQAHPVGKPGQNRVAVLFDDISDRRRAELALQELNRTLEQRVATAIAERDRAWNHARDIQVVVGLDGVFHAVNPAWTAILGHTAAQVVGRSFLDFIHPDDAQRGQTQMDAASAARPLTAVEDRYRHLDGHYRWILWNTAVEGDLVYAYGRDITADKEREAELQHTQEQLRQAQKMEAVGQLTGGIAHDFNNLLTGVIGSLDMMQRRIARGETDRIERYATTAMTSANRAAALTHRLLAFSRRQPLDPKPVSANRLISGMEELLRRTIGEQVRLEIVTAGGLWQTLCDPHQLESAILNLAINARDAMPEGGRLTVETCNAHLDNAYAAQSREVRPGQYICICVTDTGTGMTPDVIAKAWEPFFTTKPIGQGTGLGLSMIYGFARQSEGYAKVYSEVGRGTTIKLYLPRHYGEAEEAEAPAGELTDAHRAEAGETVLVVEDETAVRDLVVDVLGELGYRAVEAADGPSGLKLLQSDMRLDLLVTDVGLPGLNGRQLADAARNHRPDLKVLFMTGYAENATVANGFLDPGMAMITKPFAIEALATRIRDMIEQG